MSPPSFVVGVLVGAVVLIAWNSSQTASVYATILKTIEDAARFSADSDRAITDRLTVLENRYNASIKRFDELVADEKRETAHNIELQQADDAQAAAVRERLTRMETQITPYVISGNTLLEHMRLLASQEGRINSMEARLAAMENKLTAIQVDISNKRH